MNLFNLVLPKSQKLSFIAVLLSVAGCTTLVAHTSIDPYLSDQVKMDNLQQLAAQYCQEKHASPNIKAPVAMPDYPFTTDGCSRWPDKSWLSCCIVHDIMYWCGGSAEDREMADSIMKQCTNHKVALMGAVMYGGVRIGGSPWLPTPWRWGYGWKQWPLGYQPNNSQHNIKDILDKLRITDAVEQQLLK